MPRHSAKPPLPSEVLPSGLAECKQAFAECSWHSAKPLNQVVHVQESTYELHAICSVNDQVSGPVYCPESGACPPEKFCRSHVNFLATPRYICTHENEVPVLFFAEFSNDDEDKAEAQPLCCPVCIPPPCSGII